MGANRDRTLRPMRSKAEPALIPDSFQLAGLTWRVVQTDDVPPDQLGHCDRDRGTIRLRKSLPDDVKTQAFYHELVHAIYFTSGRDEHDEREVDAFGNLLHQFFITREA